jgi:hypothetical protein
MLIQIKNGKIATQTPLHIAKFSSTAKDKAKCSLCSYADQNYINVKLGQDSYVLFQITNIENQFIVTIQVYKIGKPTLNKMAFNWLV